jgi:glycine/D-amino acid oxidase-like deaminating enzyme/nitrite reductase/ring-hydroxylating ferredoxin subunit
MKDLHLSYWESTQELPHYPQWSGQTNYDVAIIGGGITGLTTALLLKESGYRVVVLERYKIGFGTTGSSTGYLTADPDFGYMELDKNFGKEGIQLAQMAMSEGIDLIEDICQKYNIDCDFRRLPAYHYTDNIIGVEDIKEDYIGILKADLNGRLVKKVPLPFMSYLSVKICGQAQFHSLKFLNGLSSLIDGDGSNIFEKSPVIHYENGDPCVLRVGGVKRTLKVKSIVVATHTAIGLHILNSSVVPYRSYVIASKINNEYPFALFWDQCDPYHYIRFQPHSQFEQILIVGGFDHKTGSVMDENDHYVKLEKYIREKFQIKQIINKWSAQWYRSIDGLPYIGREEPNSNVYMAIGFGGDGLTWGSISAKINRDLILGLSNQYSQLFSPSRHEPIRGMNHNADVSFTKGSDPENIKTMKIGEGRVIQKGIHKVAVYKDDKGCLHKCSAVCPHMKSILKWNNAEKTWDCPSHGGRFTYDGHVIEGAPLVDLEDLSDLVL